MAKPQVASGRWLRWFAAKSTDGRSNGMFGSSDVLGFVMIWVTVLRRGVDMFAAFLDLWCGGIWMSKDKNKKKKRKRVGAGS